MMNMFAMAGLLTCLIADNLPSNEVVIISAIFVKTYSSGNCSGITPDSLLILLVRLGTNAKAKIN
jgi:hypothetical protein